MDHPMGHVLEDSVAGAGGGRVALLLLACHQMTADVMNTMAWLGLWYTMDYVLADAGEYIESQCDFLRYYWYLQSWEGGGDSVKRR